jgi:hypothetical protein
MLIGHYLLLPLILLLFIVPKRNVLFVFMAGAIFIPMGANFMLGSLNLYPARLLILVGLSRCAIKKEMPRLLPIPLDYMFIAFGGVAIVTSLLRQNIQATLIYHAAMSLDTLGVYFLFRTWISDWEDVTRFMRSMLALSIPFACFMAIEFETGRNLFSYVGGLPLLSELRNGHVRARGPFRHSILGGTFGAVCFPMAVALWRSNPVLARIGIVLAAVIVFVSTSGGPLMTFAAMLLALGLWRYRAHLSIIVRYTVVILLLLHFFIMKVPVWYLMARIDVGGGFHRARLIDSAISHLDEWWIAGTDITRHWMPTGVGWSENNTDITNNYLRMGVVGGLPLMFAFIIILASSFKHISRTFRSMPTSRPELQFGLWCLGASLFGHVVVMISVGYYDQFFTLLYSLIAVIGSGCSWLLTAAQEEQTIQSESLPQKAASNPMSSRCVTSSRE